LLFVAGILGRTVGWSLPNQGSCQQSDLWAASTAHHRTCDTFQNRNYDTALKFMTPDGQDFRLLRSPLFWLRVSVLMNWDENMWLAIWHPPLPCFCADHSELSEAPSFIEWGTLILCFTVQYSLKSLNVFYISKSVCILLKINSHTTYTFWGLFHLIILLHPLQMFLELNRKFTLKTIQTCVMALSVQTNHEHQDCIAYCGHGKKCHCWWEWQYFRIPLSI
jgi:hypothetical protein